MSIYDVYKKDNKTKLVKCGFSWPTLFFTPLWFFYHNMFTYGFMWLFVFSYLVLYNLHVLFVSSLLATNCNYICIFLYFVFALLEAFYSNEMLENQLFLQRWRYKRTIKTRNIKEAEQLANEL